MYVHSLNLSEIMGLSTKLSALKENPPENMNCSEIRLLKALTETLEENYEKAEKFQKYLNEDRGTGFYELISQEKEILKSDKLKTIIDYCIMYNLIDYVSYQDITGISRLYRINFTPVNLD